MVKAERRWTMLLEKFSEIIDRSPIGAAVSRRKELIEQTDPRRIYPENIRSFLHIPLPLAKLLCDAAVFEGVFVKRIAYCCPNDDCGRIIETSAPGDQTDPQLICDVCEALERNRWSFPRSACRKMEYYALASEANGDH